MARSVASTAAENMDGVVDIFETSEAAAFPHGLVLSLARLHNPRGDLVQTYLLEKLVGLEKVNHSLAKVDLHSQSVVDPLGIWRDGLDEEISLAHR